MNDDGDDDDDYEQERANYDGMLFGKQGAVAAVISGDVLSMRCNSASPTVPLDHISTSSQPPLDPARCSTPPLCAVSPYPRHAKPFFWRWHRFGSTVDRSPTHIPATLRVNSVTFVNNEELQTT